MAEHASPQVVGLPRSDLEWMARVMEERFATINVRFDAANTAILKAEADTTNRFASVNEFRLSLSDQTRSFMPRIEAEALFKGLEGKIEALEKRVSARDNQKQGAGQNWAMLVSAAALASSVVTVALLLLRGAPHA